MKVERKHYRMICCRKPTFWVLLLISILLGYAVLLLTNGAIRSNVNVPSDRPGRYASVEEYLLLQVDGNQTESITVWEVPFAVKAEKPVEVAVVDRKLEYLEHQKELDESTEDGTLETWGYNWLIKIDPKEALRLSVVLNNRGMDEDGYFSQTTGQYVLVLHYPDGSYDVLGEVSLLDVTDFFGQCSGDEESIYDWYCIDRG